MEPIIITKTLHHEKENFEIRYEGMPLGEGVNLENIYHLLELFFIIILMLICYKM